MRLRGRMREEPRSSETKFVAKIGVGLLPFIFTAPVSQKGRPVATDCAAYRRQLTIDTKSCRTEMLGDLTANYNGTREAITASGPPSLRFPTSRAMIASNPVCWPSAGLVANGLKSLLDRASRLQQHRDFPPEPLVSGVFLASRVPMRAKVRLLVSGVNSPGTAISRSATSITLLRCSRICSPRGVNTKP